MKRSHRKAHGLIWLVLLPALLAFVYLAQQNTPLPAPALESAPAPSERGALP